VTGATTEQIEQSIARGDRPVFMWAALDAVNNEPDSRRRTP
jgi:hypothetical protein